MTQKQLTSYRNWLTELDQEAREQGDLNNCDSDIWSIFSPKTWTGAQIYASFSDDELLDVVIRSMEHHGHKADFGNIYCVYLEYIRRRFGINEKLKASAKARRKNLQNERKFPVDWPERVSIEPLLARSWKRQFTEEDVSLLEDICQRARATQMTPELTSEEKQQLTKFGGAGQAMKMMGIPIFRGSELRHMKQYWASERAKQAAEAAVKNEEEMECTE